MVLCLLLLRIDFVWRRRSALFPDCHGDHWTSKRQRHISFPLSLWHQSLPSSVCISVNRSIPALFVISVSVNVTPKPALHYKFLMRTFHQTVLGIVQDSCHFLSKIFNYTPRREKQRNKAAFLVETFEYTRPCVCIPL